MAQIEKRAFPREEPRVKAPLGELDLTCALSRARWPSVPAGASLADANLADFPRRAGEPDDSPRFRRAIDAAANGILEVPRGEYAIASPLVVTNRCSLEMHPAAHLVATREMDFLLTWAASGDTTLLWRTNIEQGGADMAAEARKLAENTGRRDQRFQMANKSH